MCLSQSGSSFADQGQLFKQCLPGRSLHEVSIHQLEVFVQMAWHTWRLGFRNFRVERQVNGLLLGVQEAEGLGLAGTANGTHVTRHRPPFTRHHLSSPLTCRFSP